MSEPQKASLGPELFRFTSFTQWVNKASSWYATCGIRSSYTVAVDNVGRICLRGSHFMLARDEGVFPVVVYAARVDDV